MKLTWTKSVWGHGGEVAKVPETPFTVEVYHDPFPGADGGLSWRKFVCGARMTRRYATCDEAKAAAERVLALWCRRALDATGESL